MVASVQLVGRGLQTPVYPKSESEFRKEFWLEEGEPGLVSGPVLRLAAAFIFLLDAEREIKPFVVPKSRLLRHWLLCVSGSHSVAFQRAVCSDTPGLACREGLGD